MEYIVCCCARNEEPYLDEWISHYLQLGFDHIIIADNNENDQQLPTFLANKPYANNVIVVKKNNASNFQCPFYADVYKTYPFKWCAYFDCDEFLVLPQHNTIQNYLDMFPDSCYSVSINWLCYGTNGHKKYENRPVRERFLYPRIPVDNADDINGHVKTIVRKVPLDTVEFPTPHYMKVPRQNAYRSDGTVINIKNSKNPSFSKPIQYDYAYIQHFNIKSEQEFVERSKNPRQNTTDPNKDTQIRLGMINNMGDSLTKELSRDLKRYPPIDHARGKTIIISSTNMGDILKHLAKDSTVILVGKDKSGDRLNRILNMAIHNRVKGIEWRFNRDNVPQIRYDISVN